MAQQVNDLGTAKNIFNNPQRFWKLVQVLWTNVFSAAA